MNLPTYYNIGTASVANGSTTVTGVGSIWGLDAIMMGDLFVDLAQPLVPPQRIASVASNGSLELAAPWPGATITAAPYEIRYVGIIERSTAQSRRVLEQLADVKAWYDIIVADDAGRLALESPASPLRAGYRVLVRDDGVIWAKATEAYGAWIGPVEFKGDKGDKGDVGPRGVTPRGTYSGATAYVEGDTVLYNGSSWAALQASTGNAPPVLPTTSNAYWQLLARRGTDGAGTGDVVGPASAVDGNIAQFNGATGKLMKDGLKTFSDFLQFAAQTPTAAHQGQARANIGAGVLAGFRNQIINGDFEIWQRGTTITVPAGSSAFAADRWVIINNTNQTVTALIYSLSPADLANFPRTTRRALRLNFTVAPTSGNVEVQQRIENVGTLAGKRSTATGFVYFSGSGTTIQQGVTQVFGVGGSPNADAIAAPITPVASTWAKVQALLDVPSLVGKLFGTSGEFLAFRQFITPRHATSYYLTRVSLVEGDATAEADPSPPRHIQQELALCQRYFFKPSDRWILYVPYASSGASAYQTVPLPVVMRRTPAVVKVNETVNNSSVTGIAASASSIELSIVITSTGSGYSFAWFELDAEL